VRPEKVVETTDEYFSEQDLLGQWMATQLERTTSDCRLPSARLYESFVYYAEQSGERRPGDIKWFHEQMEQHGCVRGKSNGNQVYRGLKFKSLPDGRP
jgi:putative DNA primase/helicase